MLTLGDLLDHKEFELELLTGNKRARERPILGAHNSEMAHPTEFIPPDWVVLTLGIWLRDQPEDAQRELVRELNADGICALGFGVGVAFSQPPAALLDEARLLEFPVFRVPYETPYREIVGFVNKTLIDTDFSSIQRAFSMQNYLLDAFKARWPLQDLAQRLSRLLHGEVYLFDASGRMRLGESDERGAQVWLRIMRQRVGTSAVAADDLLAMPLMDDVGREQGWLAVLGGSRSASNELVHAVMRFAERLLDFVDLQRDAARVEDQLVREEVLKAALEPLTTYDERELAGRFRRFGIDFTKPARAAIFHVGDRAGAVAPERRQMLEDTLGARGIPFLAMAEPRDLTVVMQAEADELAAWVDELAERFDLVVGAGREITRVRDVAQSLHGARTALRHLDGRLRLVDKLGLALWLVHSVAETDLVVKIDQVLGPLLDRPEFIHTLKVYFENDLNVAAAAAELFIHPNTLRYRLGQIEAILQRPLSSMATLVDVYLACLASEKGEDECGANNEIIRSTRCGDPEARRACAPARRKTGNVTCG